MIDHERLLLAHSLTGRGQIAEAEAIYHEILRRRPDEVEALNGLGALAYQAGSVEQARALFARGVAVRPDAAELHANLGETLRLLGQYDQAMGHLQKALTIKSDQPDAWNSLGLVLQTLRRYTEARAAYETALRCRPDCNAALINLGMTLAAGGQLDEAIGALRTAVSRQPQDPGALTNLAMLLIESDDPALFDEAEALCRKAIAISPRLVPAINNLGNVLKLQGRLGEATACYQKAAELEPHRGKARWNLGQVLVLEGRFEEAAIVFEEANRISPDGEAYHLSLAGLSAMCHDHATAALHYRRVIELNPGLAEAHHGLGMACLEQGRLDEAKESFDNALAIAPNRGKTLTALARLERERGDIAAACQLARRALAAEPNRAEGYCELAISLKGRLADADLAQIERLVLQKHASDETRSHLYFALASAHDARSEYITAAQYFATANALDALARKSRGAAYDPDRYSELVDRLIATFTAGFRASKAGWGEFDARPVFVVGLPRTGSSLVEQILASHQRVHGAGELTYLQDLAQRLPELTGFAAADWPGAAIALTPDLSRTAARRYLGQVAALAPATALRVIDKMPENMTLVGLIQLLLPASRVIVCSRDPRDVALSCWQTPFATIPWANDPAHIARRIADHRRLLTHWRRVAKIAWLEVEYEDLVADFEGMSQRLVEFVGLEWDPACLNFHATNRVVRTASSVQVREPIYQRSVGRWREYEASLGPLWEALERHQVTRPKPAPPARGDRSLAR